MNGRLPVVCKCVPGGNGQEEIKEQSPELLWLERSGGNTNDDRELRYRILREPQAAGMQGWCC